MGSLFWLLLMKRLLRKIRTAQLAQFNYILVIGNDEQRGDLVSIRARGSDVLEKKPFDEFLRQLNDQRAAYK